MTKQLLSIPHKELHISDYDSDLIILYNAVLNGWIPPDYISEEEYNNLKHANPSPERSLAAFTSFAGKKWGGYMRDHKRDIDFFGCQKRSLLNRDLPALKQVTTIKNQSYSNVNPINALIYADPPYIGTTGWKEFNHCLFWEWAIEISKSNELYISSYEAPEQFYPIITINTKMNLRNKDNVPEYRQEKLFVIKGK